MIAADSIFHPRTLKKALSQSPILKDGSIPAKHNKILLKWHELITSGKIKKLKEKNLQATFINDLCIGVLGYRPVTKSIKGTYNLSPEETVGRGAVDICFGKFTDASRQRQVMFELKDAHTTDMDRPMRRDKSTVQQAREYAINSQGEAEWFAVSNCVDIWLYKYKESGNAYESWQIADLIKPEEYERFMLIFAAKNLITGKSSRLYKQSLQAEKDITNELYADYRDIRIKLINGMKRENNRIRRADMVSRT